MIDWTIYRDGVALLTRADTAHDALHATVNATPLPLVHALTTSERSLVGALRVGPRWADNRRVDLVYKLSERAFEVERVEVVDLFRVALAWAGARRERKNASAWVRRGCEGVQLTRAGVPKFKRADSAKKRARVLAAVAANVHGLAQIEGADDMIASTRDAFDVSDPSWTKLDPRDASELRELLGEKGGQPRNAWGKTHCEALERALSCVRSVELAGFGVGTPVAVLRSDFDDDPLAGPGVVIDVHPSERERFDEYHSREVRLDSGAELSTSTLRLVPR